MWKIDVEGDGGWIERDSAARFVREGTSERPRLRFVLPRSRPALVSELLATVEGPFQLLFILHTPRGVGEPGRYESQPIDRSELTAFLTRFAEFFCGDGRHDLWVRSAASGELVVWDRHNDVYVYGDPEVFAGRLAALGLAPGEIAPLGPHMHHYREEFDADARDVLAALDWWRTDLRPQDEQ